LEVPIGTFGICTGVAGGKAPTVARRSRPWVETDRLEAIGKEADFDIVFL